MKYQEFKEILSHEKLPYFLPDQIHSLFSVCQSYWMYYCQYEKLKHVQCVLQNYYKDGKFKDKELDIYERLIVELLWDNYRKKKPNASQGEFFEFYLSMEDCVRKDLEKMNVPEAKLLSGRISKYNLERNSDMTIQNFNLDEYRQAMKELEENQKPQPQTVEDSMEAILDKDYAEYLLSCARTKDDHGYSILAFGIADIRYALTTGVITNHAPSPKKEGKGKHIIFAKPLAKNERQLKEAIGKILENYPMSIVEEYKKDCLKIEEIRKQAGLL